MKATFNVIVNIRILFQCPHDEVVWSRSLYLASSNSRCNTPMHRPHHGLATKHREGWDCQRRDSACEAVDWLIPRQIMGSAMMGVSHVDLETALV